MDKLCTGEWQIGLWSLIIFLFIACTGTTNEENVPQMNQESRQQRPDYVLVIHGGAGTISRKTVTPEQEAAITAALNQALETGKQILEEGGSSLDAVENVVRTLENSPHFNAGKGAVFTHEGRNELDASIMDGRTLNAGSIGGVRHIRNPISLARAVMANSPHVMLTGKGAEEFAVERGFSLVDSSYFFTDRRWKSLQRVREREQQDKETGQLDPGPENDHKFGTVGAVALDKDGHLAAATSTGGMTNKRYGRIGDSPIIGAGTYADDTSCAVSCTGHGEYFIRLAIAHDLHARVAYGKQSLEEAGRQIIEGSLEKLGGTGGLIAVDKSGNITMPFNTEGMYRGFVRPDTQQVFLYK